MAANSVHHPLSLGPAPDSPGRGALPARVRPLTHAEGRAVAVFNRTFGRNHVEANTQTFVHYNPQPFLSFQMHGGQDINTDWSYLWRAPADHTILDNTLGFSTVENVVLGVNSYLGASQNAERAHFVGSETEERAATLDRVRGVTSLTNGALYIGVRGTGLASAVSGVTVSMQAPTLLGRVTYVLSSLGSALSGFGYLLLGGSCVMKIYNAYKFRKELEARSVDNLTLDNFIGECSGERQAGVHNGPYTAEELDELCQEAISSTAELLRIKLQEAGYEEFFKAERQQFVETLFSLQGLSRDQIAQIGAHWKIEKARAKHKLELSSFIGPLAVDREQPVQVQKAQILAAMDKKFWTNVGYLVACVLGIAMTITAFAATGGAAAIIVAVGSVIVALTLTGLDGYDFYEKLSNPVGVAQFDRTMLAISTVIGALATLTAIVLMSVFSAGAGPIVAAIVIGLFWLSMNGFLWWKLPSDQAVADDSAIRLRNQAERRRELKELLTPVLTTLLFTPEFIEELLPAPERPQLPQLIPQSPRNGALNPQWRPGAPDSP